MKRLILSAVLLLCGEAVLPELPAATNAPTGDLATNDVQPAARGKRAGRRGGRRGRRPQRRRAARRVGRGLQRGAVQSKLVVNPVTGLVERQFFFVP